MNLTIDDVDMLIERLKCLSEASVGLRALGTEPVIRMLPGEPVVITAGVVLPADAEFGPAPPFVIEPHASIAAAEAAPEATDQNDVGGIDIAPADDMAGGAGEPGELGDVQQLVNVDCPPADAALREQDAVLEGAAGEPLAGAMPAAEPQAGAPFAAPKTGPMTEEEKARLWLLQEAGLGAREIAATMGRRLQQVASIIHNSRRRPDAPAAAETTGQPVQAVTSTAPPVAPTSSLGVADLDDKPETPAAGAEVPSADTGQPVRMRPAGVTAPEAGGAAPASLEGLTLRQRHIAAEVAALGYRKPWTAALDLAVVEDLTRGRKAPEIALDLGIDLKLFSDRVRRLYDAIRDSRGQVMITAQQDLLAVLRHRAGA